MILIPLALGLSAFVPQDASAEHRAVIVACGALEGGALRTRGFDLGDGGIAKVGRAADPGASPGRFVTPGGVIVRVQREGVKLEFQSGGELLIANDLAAHVRSGEHTEPGAAALELVLGDGSRVRAFRDSAARAPLARVEVETEAGVCELWRGQSGEIAEAALRRSFHGVTLFALGDGTALYAVVPFGPVLVCERVLASAAQAAKLPRIKVVIAGDLLVDSLRELPRHAPRKSVQYPQIEEGARELAELAPRLFAPGIVTRPPGALGEPVLPLGEDWRLRLVLMDHGALRLELHRGTSEVPAIEWTVGARTELRFVRPDGGANGGPRWFLGGIPVETRGLVRGVISLRARDRARSLLAELGVRRGH